MPIYERIPKASHLHTIWYEIDMLEFAFRRLTEATPRLHSPEWNLLIEAFLLHYRNLIQFFSGNERKHRNGDLNTCEPMVWAGRALTEHEVNSIQRLGRALEDKYWEDISQFLQHCTIRRSVDVMSWNITLMFTSLGEVVGAFACSFPRPTEEPTDETELPLKLDGASTTTVTRQDSLQRIHFPDHSERETH